MDTTNKTITNLDKIFTSNIDLLLQEGVNLPVSDVIALMDVNTAIEVIRVLKIVHGISYTRQAKLLGISRSEILVSNHHGTFSQTVREHRLQKGIIQFQNRYLGHSPLEFLLQGEA